MEGRVKGGVRSVVVVGGALRAYDLRAVLGCPFVRYGSEQCSYEAEVCGMRRCLWTQVCTETGGQISVDSVVVWWCGGVV